MYSYNDFERLFLRYKLEEVPSGISIEQFCLSNKVPYNLFAKWYKDSRKKIVPLQVLGTPPTELDSVETSLPILSQAPTGDSPVPPPTKLRILVDIRMSNGVIHQQLDREPEDGDVFIVMSKDLRLVRLFSYDRLKE
nr:hypothetical protein [uncultured Bacteroides sp.]